MVTIVIGRDQKTAQLRMSVNGMSQVFGQKDSVPTNVSREHVSFTIADDGTMVVKNLDIQNYTYVNMVGVESKRVKENDRIELGGGHYVLDWEYLKPFIPKYADIRPMKKVWDDYQNELLEIQIKEKRFGVLRSATGLITMAAILLSMFTSRDNPLYMTLYISAAVISALFFVKAYLESSKIPTRIQELKDELPKKYLCPNCGRYLGGISYDIVCQNDKCPHCQAIYKK